MPSFLEENSVNVNIGPGASTAAKQDTGNASLASIDAKLTDTTGGALKVDGSGFTQPVSGTVTATQTTGANLHTVVDSGSITATISGTSSVSVTNFPATQPVSGTVAATQSGTWTVQPGNTANTTAWKVDGSAVTQPVSGTVTSNVGTTNGLALDATITSGNGKVQVVGPGGTATIVSASGALNVTNEDGQKQTYSATSVVAGFAPAAAATDIFTIYGSGTKTIRIARIEISGTQTTAGDVSIALVRRSSVNTGGTSSSLTATPHDSANAAATATVLSYTANPAVLGAAVGKLRAEKFFAPAPATASSPQVADWRFGESFAQSIVLRGTGEGVTLNLNAATMTGGLIDCWVEWTEE